MGIPAHGRCQNGNSYTRVNTTQGMHLMLNPTTRLTHIAYRALTRNLSDIGHVARNIIRILSSRRHLQNSVDDTRRTQHLLNSTTPPNLNTASQSQRHLLTLTTPPNLNNTSEPQQHLRISTTPPNLNNTPIPRGTAFPQHALPPPIPRTPSVDLVLRS
jgi:hypothetical protein